MPVINENDTISVSEIRFGDNDRLAAMVTNLLQAPLMVVLSVADGLRAMDPAIDPDSPLVPLVTELDDRAFELAGASKSRLGAGGMRSKLEAAQLVTRAGGSVIIASGLQDRPLERILAGEPLGTLFLGSGSAQGARKRWIGLTARPKGRFIVDEGARAALETGSKSLLAIGVVDVEGKFEKGEVVGIRDPEGREFARGLTNYDASDALKIRGLRADAAREALGTTPYAEVVHKDNLVIIR